MIEVLVVIFVIAIVVALVLAAVMRAREAGRRIQCTQNLHQIGLGVQSYSSTYGVFPPGYQAGSGTSFLVAILPYVEMRPLHELIQNGGITTAQAISLALYHCPSDGGSPSPPFGPTNYAGNQGTGVQAFGYNGAFANEAVVSPSQFTDGTSTTAPVSEWLIGTVFGLGRDPARSAFHTPESWTNANQLDIFAAACRGLDLQTARLSHMVVGMLWTHGDFGHAYYNHILTIGENTCLNGEGVQIGAWTAKSNHSGGANVLFADGDVRFLSTSINPKVWTALGSRSGGEVVSGAY